MKVFKIGLIMLIVAVAIHAFFSWYAIIRSTAPDFGVYYYSARRLLDGLSIYGDTGLFTGLGYPPQSMLLYTPLTVLPFPAAQLLWVSCSFLSLLVIVYFSFLLAGKKPSLFVYSLACAFFFVLFPTKFTLGMGQVNVIALVMVLLVFLLQKKKSTWAGVLFGIAVLLKPQCVFLLAYFLLQKKFTLSGTFLLFMLLVTLITSWLFGADQIIRYITVESRSLSLYVERDIYYNQGFSGLLSRLMADSAAQYGVHAARIIVLAVTAIAVWPKRNKLHELSVFFLACTVMILPVVWQHHLVFLFPLAIWISCRIRSVYQIFLFVISMLLIGINIRSPESVTGVFAPLVLSHGFFGMVLLWLLGLKLLKKQS
jgi:hypothetical protein